MYIALDMDRRTFTHKHADLETVANLVFIEAPFSTVHIIPHDDPKLLVGATLTELQGFWRNATGDEVEVTAAKLRGMLCELAQWLKPTECDPREVEAQAERIEAKDPEGLPDMRYVAGSLRPGTIDELWEGSSLTQCYQDGEVPIVAPAPAQRAENVAKPRTGSTKALIWEVADRMWQADGRPGDKAQVLALRRAIMDVLEREHGIKRTSASSELGQWQKARI